MKGMELDSTAEEAKTLDPICTALDSANDCHVDDCDSSMLCHPGSRLLRSAFTMPHCTEEVVMFVNSGCEVVLGEGSSMSFMADTFYEGGDTYLTNDQVREGGEFPFIYHSARHGNFCYRFQSIPPGDYFVDFHFVEIQFTYGPKGIRVFNVYMQDEKVFSDLDIFSIVGGNKPLQLVDSRISVKDDGLILIRFEGVNDSPLVSGICIRKAPAPDARHGYLICSNCSTEVEVPTDEKRVMQIRSTTKYEKKIEELSALCQMKTNECHQAWMSLTQANEQLEKVRMELDNKLFRTYSLDEAVVKQAEELRIISTMYKHEKEFWIRAVHNLEHKIKALKEDHSQLSHEARECADSIPDLNQMVFAVQSLVAQCEDLKVKYSEEQAKRRKLYNDVQEAKGNIRVFCRCRPLNKGEAGAGYATVVDFDAAKDGELSIKSSGSMKKIFKFDGVYSPRDDQAYVYADASPVVTSVLDGYNVCIFAYGQTGTGKTFTMEGTEQNRGVNYRTLEELFEIAMERSETHAYNISVSVLEVYNEQIRDLLSPSSKKLEVKQASEGYHHVPGLVEAKVENIREVWNVLQAGSSARAVGSNNVNEHSSRSHCMLCVIVSSKNLMNGECTKSKLWLVDLAGSERLGKTEAHGDRLKEAQNINRSLSALGDVISALASKSSYIPYRNSKLTHLLQDSLGGDSKTLMFVQISPSEHDISETVSSLNFATRVRGVELGPAKKQIDTSEFQKMKAMLDKAKQESRSKDEALRKLEESFQSMESKAKGKDQFYKNQLEKIKELEVQLELKTALQSQSEKQALNLSERLKGKDEMCTCLQQKVKELEGKLREQAQSESSTYKQMKDLENKLIEQVRNSDFLSASLQNKVKELERKLEEKQELNTESFLRQKIKELEDKLREQAQQLLICKPNVDLFDGSRATPRECRHNIVKDGTPNDSDHLILKSSHLTNRRGSIVKEGSTFLKGNDTLNETRSKRLSRNSDTENRNAESNSFNDKKIRRQDPPKPYTKITKSVVPVSTSQKPLTHSRIGDQAQGVKEKDSKKRIWSR